MTDEHANAGTERTAPSLVRRLWDAWVPSPSGPSGAAATPAGAAAAPYIITTHRVLLALVLLSLLLKTLIFEPIGWWPLAFVCLVPWMVMIGAAEHAPRVYFYSYVFGLLFFAINMRWLYAATGLGYAALSVYQAAYFPLAACAIRHVVRRRRWALAVSFPLIWVGTEMLRAVVLSGFPWFFLSHSCYEVLTLIQVSDLVGAYGLSFVIAAVNGAVADCVLAWLREPSAAEEGGSQESGVRRQGTGCQGNARRTFVPSCFRACHAARRGLVFAGTLLAIVLVYGQIQLHRDTTRTGPRIALIQGDFLKMVDRSQAVGHDLYDDPLRMEVYLDILEAAASSTGAAGERPDLFLLPESPWAMYLNEEARGFHAISRDSYAALQAAAAKHQAYVVTGSATLKRNPLSTVAKEKRYNSATVFPPGGGETQHYDKVHLVLFGEFVPLRFGRFHSVYLWLNSLMPFSGPDGREEFSLFRGDEFRVFTMRPRQEPDRVYRFGIPICYEDVVPYVARAFVAGGSETKRADFLLNISNDGWFGRGVQQVQHLAVCVFRAVENRVGIARAVNTGVSAFIQPSGRIHVVVQRDASRGWPGECGFAAANVGVDTRYTWYSRYGDWFGWACAVAWLALFTDYWLARAAGAKSEWRMAHRDWQEADPE